MRAAGTLKLKPTAGHLAGDVSRAFWAGGLLVGVCGLAAGVALWVHASNNSASRYSGANEGDLSTGSLLVVSPSGRLCSQRTIDNNTWQIRDQGWVDCDQALAKTAHTPVDNRPAGGSRLDLIRESFRSRQ